MFVKPPGPRHQLTETGDGISIRIPAKRNPIVFAILTLWLCGWTFGLVSAPIVLIVNAATRDPGAVLFMIVWLSLWTIAGALFGYFWLWMFRGREIVNFTRTALSIKRDIFKRGRTKNYDKNQVRGLRIAPLTFNPFDWANGLAFWGIGGGLLAFEYGYKTFRFGAGIEEAEARLILQSILSRFPELGREAAS